MKKYLVIVLLAFLVLNGCVNKKENSNINTKQQKIEKTAEESVNYGTLNVIENINNWKHPVKDIFECKNLKIIKAEISENKNYYVFHLKSLDSSYFIDKKFLISVAEQIGFNNFKIVSEKKFGDVKCDKIQEIIKNVTTDFAKIEFTELSKEEIKKDETIKENSKEKESNSNLSSKQKKAIEIAEKFAKKNLHEIGYSEGITNMSVNSEDGDEIVLKVWNKGSTTSETIDWLIVDLKSCKVTSENFSN